MKKGFSTPPPRFFCKYQPKCKKPVRVCYTPRLCVYSRRRQLINYINNFILGLATWIVFKSRRYFDYATLNDVGLNCWLKLHCILSHVSNCPKEINSRELFVFAFLFSFRKRFWFAGGFFFTIFPSRKIRF